MPDSSIRLVLIGGTAPRDIEQVLAELRSRSQLAVIVHCVDGDGLPQRLRSGSSLVDEVRGTTKIESGHIYVVPPDERIEIKDRALVILPKATPNNTLDILLRSAADAYGAQTVGVILAGPGTSGLLGIKRVKEVGGITIAQAGMNGENLEMPHAAIGSGMIDLVLTPPEIGARLQALGAHRPSEEKAAPDGAVDTLRDILTLVRIRSGHDFASYKRATLFRRISRRMQVCQTETVSDYHQYLRDHPQELSALLRDFLISVTNFFRDGDAFLALASQVIPKLFLGKQPNEQIRIWVPGCATGEEVYSLAMLVQEHAAAIGATNPIQLFATDIDEDSLTEARNGRYPESIIVDVPQARLDRFFTRETGYYRITKELRELVLFSPHNLLRDPPFSRLDLVSCRNLMIYLNREAQDRVLNLFHFGLKLDGYLFLGSSESAENTAMFSVLDPKFRIYQRHLSSVSPHALDGTLTTGRWHAPAPVLPPPSASREDRPTSLGEVHFRVVEQYAPPSVLVNHVLDIIHVSEHAGRFLTVAGGEPTKQLLRLVIPELRLDLRTAIFGARQPGQSSETRLVRFEQDGKARAIEIRVVASHLDDVAPGALLVMFDEKPTSEADLREIDRDATVLMEPLVREIEDELQRTRNQLRTTIEQYETSLEELKASNEELQAINEELRSATEELETSKEELQSVNEELTTLNHELKVKVDEISHANSDLQNLMSSTDIGVLFLDRKLNIKRFTPRAQDLFNVIPTDIGRPFSHITHKITTNDVAEQAQRVLQTLRTSESEVASQERHRYLMRMLPYRSLDDRIDGVVVTFVDVTDLRAAVEARQVSEAALAASEARLRSALLTAPLIMMSIDRQGHTTWGYAFGKELAPERAIEMFAKDHAQQFAKCTREVLEKKLGNRIELEVVIEGKSHTYDFRIEPTAHGVDAVGFDITPSKLAEASLRETDRRKDEFLATLSHELRNPLTPLKVALDVAKLANTDETRRTRSFEIMDRQVGQLEQLVDELLDLSRITQGKIDLKRDPIDVTHFIENALEATRPIISEHKHDLRVVLPNGQHRVTGDLTRLTQVMTNLLSNAAKYTPDGGAIELAVVPVPARGMIQVRVRDTGIGIAPEMLTRIFDIFVQVRNPQGVQGGLGIGLNLVRRIVELHGGTVTASSAGEHRGSEFLIELPLRRS